MTDVIHIINPLGVAHGGSEWEAVSLFEMLSASQYPDKEIRIWSTQRRNRISKYFLSRYPIRCISRFGIKRPKKGTLIFVGAYFKIRHWYDFSNPSRIIIIYNVSEKEELDILYKRSLKICKQVEVVHISKWMRSSCSYGGVIHYSPISLIKFQPVRKAINNVFTVGRLSRDTQDKFSEDDPDLFRMIADMGCRVRLMGATTLESSLSGYKGIEILHAAAEEPDVFLSSLDCFIYRTHDSWTEPFGRVVMEAMACGLPVVCENKGGYVEVIEHGKNGFLFSDTQEALGIVQKLKSDQDLCRHVGEQARFKMESIYAGKRLKKRIEYYMRYERV
jgi:glycosyltransferase involved in cell wall biosynthesis